MGFKEEFDHIHLIGNEIRNYGNSIREKDEFAFRIAKEILNKNNESPIMTIQALSVVRLFEDKYGKEKSEPTEKISNELMKNKEIGNGR